MPRWLQISLLGAGLFLTGCGGSGDGGTDPGPIDLGGPWSWREKLTVAATHLACADTGSVSVSQTGAAFTGSGFQAGSCTLGGGPPGEYAFSFDLAGGQITGSLVSFTVQGCAYSGQLRGDSVLGTLDCALDVDDLRARAKGIWSLVPAPPSVSAAVSYPAGDTLAVAGDVVTLEVHAEARRELAWVGYELGPPISRRDSVRVEGHEADHAFAVTAPAQGGAASVTVFARDVRGSRSQPRIGDLVVLADFTRRPTRLLTLDAPVRDLLVDAKRGRVYLSQPAAQRIASVGLSDGTYGPSISLSFPSAGIDLTAGGDSLVIASGSGPRIGVVALSAATPRVAIVNVATGPEPNTGWVGDWLRVLANNKVLLTLQDPSLCCEGWLSEYDLASGISKLRLESGPPPGDISNQEPMARAGDGSRLVMVDACCTPLRARTYVSATDAFAGRVEVTVPGSPNPVSADIPGTRFLIATALFDADLQPVQTFDQPEYDQGGATILSPDASVAYLAIYHGYLKLRTSDGTVLERVRLPRWCMAFAITPDGNTLIATSGTAQAFGSDELIMLVDLR